MGDQSNIKTPSSPLEGTVIYIHSLKGETLIKSLTSLGKELRIDGLECLFIHHSTGTLLLKGGRKY